MHAGVEAGGGDVDASTQTAVDVATTTDADLLRGCREGQADSWDALVRRYERLVYGVAVRSGLRPADAADVTQATFIALLNATDLRDSDRLPAWLATVSRRKAWRLRSRMAREVPLAELPEPSTSPLPWEDAAALHDALERLPEPCRTLVLALYFEPDRPTYLQIAERLDRSPGGVGPLRGRCLERLRAVLEAAEQ